MFEEIIKELEKKENSAKKEALEAVKAEMRKNTLEENIKGFTATLTVMAAEKALTLPFNNNSEEYTLGYIRALLSTVEALEAAIACSKKKEE